MIADRDYGSPEVAHYLFSLLGIGLLFYVNSGWLFLFLLVSQISMCLYALPHSGNHVIFLAIINTYILFQFFMCRENKVKVSNQEYQNKIFKQILPDLRCFVVILYLCSAFHKLNSGFFNTSHSCMVHIYSIIQSSWLSFLPIKLEPLAITFFIWLTLVVEGIFPILLFFRHSRLLALVGLIMFHAFIGIRYFEFSIMMFFLIFLFMPESFLKKLCQIIKEDFLYKNNSIKIIVKVIATVVALLFSPLIMNDSQWGFFGRTIKGWLWLGVIAFIIFESLRMGFYRKIKFEKEKFSLKISGAGFIFSLLIVINALSPYLGVKTIGAFAMYSNLHTESYSNHYIMPKGLIQVVNYQDDLVHINQTNLPIYKLRKAMNQNQLLPLFEVQSEISSFHQTDKKYYIHYHRLNNNTPYWINDISAKNHSNIKNIPWYKKKIFSYHFVNHPGQPDRCQW